MEQAGSGLRGDPVAPQTQDDGTRDESSELVALRSQVETLKAALARRDKDVESIATMLGCGNVPPLRILEADISAMKARLRELPALQAAVREVRAEMLMVPTPVTERWAKRLAGLDRQGTEET